MPPPFRRKFRLSYRFQSCPILKSSGPCLVQLVCVYIVTSNTPLEQHKQAIFYALGAAHALGSIRFGESSGTYHPWRKLSDVRRRESVVRECTPIKEHILVQASTDKAHRIDLDAFISDFFRQRCRQSLQRELRCTVMRVVSQPDLPRPRADVDDPAAARGGARAVEGRTTIPNERPRHSGPRCLVDHPTRDPTARGLPRSATPPASLTRTRPMPPHSRTAESDRVLPPATCVGSHPPPCTRSSWKIRPPPRRDPDAARRASDARPPQLGSRWRGDHIATPAPLPSADQGAIALPMPPPPRAPVISIALILETAQA